MNGSAIDAQGKGKKFVLSARSAQAFRRARAMQLVTAI